MGTLRVWIPILVLWVLLLDQQTGGAQVPRYLKNKYGTNSASSFNKAGGATKTKTSYRTKTGGASKSHQSAKLKNPYWDNSGKVVARDINLGIDLGGNRRGGSSVQKSFIFKGGCTKLPSPMSAAVKCSQNSGCRATCMENFEFPNGKTELKLICVDGNWISENNEFPTVPNCQPICSPPCQNNGICMSPGQCYCPKDFSGPQCQFETKPCLNYPPMPKNSRRTCNSKQCTITCLNGHEFSDGSQIATMDCKNGFWTPTKDKWNSIPDCLATCDPPCQNGGNCLSFNVCQCPQDFRGAQCQYDSEVCSPKLLNFNGGYNCSGDMESFSCSLNCPAGIDFEFPAESVYTCNYALGFFLPAPIPNCVYPDNVNIQEVPGSYETWHTTNYTEWSGDADSKNLLSRIQRELASGQSARVILERLKKEYSVGGANQQVLTLIEILENDLNGGKITEDGFKERINNYMDGSNFDVRSLLLRIQRELESGQNARAVLEKLRKDGGVNSQELIFIKKLENDLALGKLTDDGFLENIDIYLEELSFDSSSLLMKIRKGLASGQSAQTILEILRKEYAKGGKNKRELTFIERLERDLNVGKLTEQALLEQIKNFPGIIESPFGDGVTETIFIDGNNQIIEGEPSHQIIVETKIPKPGVCFSWGGSHYKTFDNRVYSFNSDCPHILVRDSQDNTFSIITQNADICHTNVTECYKNINVYLQNVNYRFSKNANGQLTFKSGNKTFPIPGRVPGVRVEMQAHNLLVSLDTVGVNLLWDGEQLIQVGVKENLWNRTEGLCGVLDGDPSTDLITQDGQTPKNILTFANTWKVDYIGDRCEESPTQDLVCLSAPDKLQNATSFCQKLVSDRRFKQCQNVLDVGFLIDACLSDYCNCPNEDSTQCACDTFDVYVKHCSYFGIDGLANWRDENTCPMKCTNGKIYRSCGNSNRQPTCGSISEGKIEAEASCVEGCFCPTGTVLHDDKCITRDKCPCMLRGKSFKAGSSVPKGCNTCTCNDGTWQCTQVDCGARCSAIGDPHYVTFDGKKFDFMGKCSYYLVKSANFSIEAENIPCAGSISQAMNFPTSILTGMPSCTKAVTIRVNDQVIRLKQNHELVVNGQDIFQVPFTIAGIKIKKVSSIFLLTTLPNGIDVWWDGSNRVYVDLPAKFKEETRGLCGTFNNNQKDDFLTPQDDIEQSVIAFANKWKTTEHCQDLPEVIPTHPCDRNIHRKSQAENYCLRIKSELFKDCHWFVDPDQFYRDCLYDMCSCEFTVSKCLCPIIASYASECSRQGIKVDWRSEIRECGVHCPGGQKYQVCGNSCTRTCRDISDDAKCKPQCVEGCNCPEGQTLDDNDECVPIAQCKCQYRGMEYPAGYKEIRPAPEAAQLCTCVNAEWDCYEANDEDKKLYPSSELVQNKCNASANLEFTTCEPVEALTCKNMHSPPQYSPAICHAGCQCKDGYVLDTTSKQCVKPTECPCHHASKSYKEEEVVQSGCNTCTCKNGKWSCTDRQCAAECSVWGDSHYKTFDGRRFDYQGECDYVLAKGNLGQDSFHVSVQNVPCGSLGTACFRSVTIKVTSGGGSDVITLEKEKPIPSLKTFKHILVREKGEFVIVEAPEMGFVVHWDRGTRVYVRVDPRWKDQTKGLCGNYNDNEVDDFQTPSGGLAEVSANIFGDSWRLQSYCSEAPEIKDTCSQRPERKIWSTKKCGLLKSSVFAACHSEVPVDYFFEKCIFDSCACDQGGDCECMCTALAAYAQECNNRGAPVKWRTPEFCPMQCDERCTTYSPCISTCPEETCDNLLTNKKYTTSCGEDSCIEGCAPKRCPPGHVYGNSSHFECVPIENCRPVCLIVDGVTYYEGDLIEEDDCHTCYCSREEKKCSGQPCTTTTLKPTITTVPADQQITCEQGWTTWINQVPSSEKEELREEEREPVPSSIVMLGLKDSSKCNYDMMVDMECRTVKGHISAKQLAQKTGLDIECSLERGLICKSNRNEKQCPDFEIRVNCRCGASTATPFTTTVLPQTVTTEAVITTAEPSCVIGDSKEDINDCSVYFICVPNPSINQWKKLSCAEGTLYNPVKKVCDWPNKVAEIKPSCASATTYEPIPTCPPGTVYDKCAIQCDRLCLYYDYLIKKQGLCKGETKCEAGCRSAIRDRNCPAGSAWLNEQTCVNVGSCMCVSDNGKPVKPGKIFEEPGCKKCQCFNNAYTCQEYPCTTNLETTEEETSPSTKRVSTSKSAPTETEEETLSTKRISTSKSAPTETEEETSRSTKRVSTSKSAPTETEEETLSTKRISTSKSAPTETEEETSPTTKRVSTSKSAPTETEEETLSTKRISTSKSAPTETEEETSPSTKRVSTSKSAPTETEEETSPSTKRVSTSKSAPTETEEETLSTKRISTSKSAPTETEEETSPSTKRVSTSKSAPTETEEETLSTKRISTSKSAPTETEEETSPTRKEVTDVFSTKNVPTDKQSPVTLTTQRTSYATPSVTPPGECIKNRFVSLIDGDSPLPDEAFSASSVLEEIFSPSNARLNSDVSETSGGSWAPQFTNEEQYLEVDLGKQEPVYGVIVKGSPLYDEYVTSYRVLYSPDGHTFYYILDKTTKEPVVFRGSTDSTTEVKQFFDVPVEAKKIRINPLTWNNGISLRVELIGCEEARSTPAQTSKVTTQTTRKTTATSRTTIVIKTTATPPRCNDPLGLEDGTMSLSQVKVSSSINAKNDKPSLKLDSNSAWQPLTNSPTEWVVFDFLEPRELTGLVTKGGPDGWVENYVVEYSHDGTNWNKILYEKKERLFPGNYESNQPQVDNFDIPIRARYLKVIPRKWKNNIQMRIEVRGCYLPYPTTQTTKEASTPSTTAPTKRVTASSTKTSTTSAQSTPSSTTTFSSTEGTSTVKQCDDPLGIEDSTMSLSQITVSSSINKEHSKPSLKLNSTTAWQPVTNTPNEWIAFDFVEPRELTGVVTKGGPDGWVTSYIVKYSPDGKTWDTVFNENGTPEFPGNNNSDTPQDNKFESPITTRYLKVIPQTWNNNIQTRIEIKGCYLPYPTLSTKHSTTVSQPTRIPTTVSRSTKQPSSAAQSTSTPYSHSESTTVSKLGTQSTAATEITEKPTTVKICDDPLGLEDSTMSLSQITVSSSKNEEHGKPSLKLNSKTAWQPVTNSTNEWIVFDFLETRELTGVVTKGGPDGRVESYVVESSPDKKTWDTVMYEDGRPIFPGNTDSDTPQDNKFKSPITARYLRITPKTWNNVIQTRVEVHGCYLPYPTSTSSQATTPSTRGSTSASSTRVTTPSTTASTTPYISTILSSTTGSTERTSTVKQCDDPLGLEDSTMSLSQITVSSSVDEKHSKPSLKLNSTTAWQPVTNTPDEWIAFDFVEPRELTGVLTKGGPDGWVTSYIVKYSPDGKTWDTVFNESGTPEFPGNNNSDTPQDNKFESPITTRYLKVIPQTWNNNIQTRIEIKGCYLPYPTLSTKHSTTVSQSTRVPTTASHPTSVSTLETQSTSVSKLGSQSTKLSTLGTQSTTVTTERTERPTTVKICDDPLGLEDSTMSLSQITVSSSIDKEHSKPKLKLDSKTAWQPVTNTTDEWIVFDFLETRELTGVVTKGGPDGRVESYVVESSPDKKTWNKVLYEDGRPIFPGNTDSDTSQDNKFESPITARYLRITPKTWNNVIQTRVEVHGCYLPYPTSTSSQATTPSTRGSTSASSTRVTTPSTTASTTPYISTILSSTTGSTERTSTVKQCDDPLGLEDSTMSLSQITVSSSIDKKHSKPSLKFNSTTAWQPVTNTPDEWIAFDFVEPRELTGVVTKGGPDGWVESYIVQYSPDGKTWVTVLNENGEPEFPGNYNADTPQNNKFKSPITTRYLKVTPQTWNNNIQTRIEIKGCYLPYPTLSTKHSTTVSQSTRIPTTVSRSTKQPSSATQSTSTPTSQSESTTVSKLGTQSTAATEITEKPTTVKICDDPLGLEDSTMSLSQITVSSSKNEEHGKPSLKLNSKTAWQPVTNSTNEWIVFDFLETRELTGVVTKGGPDGRMESYVVESSPDKKTWDTVMYEDGRPIFPGNTDSDTPQDNKFKSPITARYLRITPKTWNNVIQTRVEVHGCYLPYPTSTSSQATTPSTRGSTSASSTRVTTPSTTASTTPYISTILSSTTGSTERTSTVKQCDDPLGLEDSTMSLSQITVSSSVDEKHSKPSLKLNSTTAWQPVTNTPDEWIAFDFVEPRELTGVVTKGGPDGWVTSYIVKYSPDGKTWDTVFNENGTPEFPGNNNSDTPQDNKFESPITTRYLKVIPQTWNNNIQTRIEIKGCYLPYPTLSTKHSTTVSQSTRIPTTVSRSTKQPSSAAQSTSTPTSHSESTTVSKLGTQSTAATEIPEKPTTVKICDDPLGLEDSTMSLSQITVSSSKNEEHGKPSLKLNSKTAWQPVTNSTNEWIVFDFLETRELTGVVTKGGPDGRVESYVVESSPDKKTWNKVLYEDGRPIFPGNTDSDTSQDNKFESPITARYLRITPKTWNNVIQTRVEVHGCYLPYPTSTTSEATTTSTKGSTYASSTRVTTPTTGAQSTRLSTTTLRPTSGSTQGTSTLKQCDDPLGLANGDMSLSQISVSSSINSEHDKSNLKIDSDSAWQPISNSAVEWILFDFLDERELTGIVTKGGPDGWVVSYTVQYSHDGNTWNKVLVNQNERVFNGNVNSVLPKINYFDLPIRARYLKIVPKSWKNVIQLRVEILGCYKPYPTQTTEEILTSTPIYECNYCPGIEEKNSKLKVCRCSPTKYWNGKSCVDRAECPCVVGFIKYPVGAVFEKDDCSECTCKLGGVDYCTPKQCQPCAKGLRSTVTATCACSCKPCEEGTTLCPTSNICINSTLWCNGIEDCPDDEVDCASTTTTSEPVTTPSSVSTPEEVKTSRPTSEETPVTEVFTKETKHTSQTGKHTFKPTSQTSEQTTGQSSTRLSSSTIKPTRKTTKLTTPKPTSLRPTSQSTKLASFTTRASTTLGFTPTTTVAPTSTRVIEECREISCPPGFDKKLKNKKSGFKFTSQMIINSNMNGGTKEGKKGGSYQEVKQAPKKWILPSPATNVAKEESEEECKEYVCVPKFPNDGSCPDIECPKGLILVLDDNEQSCQEFHCEVPPPPDSVCKVDGRSFITFDNVEYKYDICNHVLVRDLEYDEWKISLKKACTNVCSRDLIIQHGWQSLVIHPDYSIEYDGYTYTLEQAIILSEKQSEFLISRVGNNILFTSNKYGFWIIWNHEGDVQIGVDQSLIEKVDGLCGYFDDDKDGDKRRPDGSLAKTTVDFGDSWALSHDQPQICEAKACPIEMQNKAWEICNKVKDRSFDKCSHVVDVESFTSRCLETTCTCLERSSENATSDDHCRCEALQNFVVECLSSDSTIDLQSWRVEQYCPVNCEAPFIFDDCYQRRCEPSCTTFANPRTCPKVERMCFPGCYCPPGYVREGKKCIPPSKCKNCECDLLPHLDYLTYDDNKYTVNGNCTYVMSRDILEDLDKNHRFQVLVTNRPCVEQTNQQSANCIAKITILYEGHTIEIEKDQTKPTLTLNVDEQVVENYREIADIVRVLQEGRDDLKVILPDIQVEVYVTYPSLETTVKAPSYIFGGKMEGICGNCNGKKNDDFRLPDGKKPKDEQDFGLGWLFEDLPGGQNRDECKEVKEEKCELDPNAPDPCLQLVDVNKFGQCANILDPAKYLLWCRKDTCKGYPAGSCEATEAYAKDCAKLGFCVHWRNELCPAPVCPHGLFYAPCGPAHPETCETIIDSNKPSTGGSHITTDVCYCPKGTVLNNDTCVTPSECITCDNEGHHPGEVWNKDKCTKCTCEDTTVKCETQKCTDPSTICERGYIAVKIPTADEECCDKYTCVPEPTVAPICEKPQPLICGENQVTKLETKANGCPVYVCECIPKEECENLELSTPATLKPGYIREIDYNSTCCPIFRLVCDKERCPLPEPCPQFYLTKVEEGECCPTFTCNAPENCITVTEFTAAPEGGERPLTDLEKQNVLKNVNDTWKDGPCRECKCQYNEHNNAYVASCSKMNCPSIEQSSDFDDYELVAENVFQQCCPTFKRTGCKYNGKIQKEGEVWLKEDDHCTTLMCAKSDAGYIQKETRVKHCDNKCDVGFEYVEPARNSTDCCGSCKQVACVVDGAVYEIGSEWISTDFCTKYVCSDVDGSIQVKGAVTKCPTISEEELNGFVFEENDVEGECCRRRVHTACKVDGNVVNIGETWPSSTDKCKTYACIDKGNNELVTQETVHTCKTECGKGWEYQPSETECCGKCVQVSCVVEEEVWEEGQTWTTPDNCTRFSCEKLGDHFTIITQQVSCPPIDASCDPKNIYSDGCCQYCNITGESLKKCMALPLPEKETVGILKVSDCSNRYPIKNFTECVGSCESSTTFNLALGKVQSKCSCCQAVAYNELLVELECADGSRIQKSVEVPSKCSCAITECEGKLKESEVESYPANPRARRWSFFN